jgi:signal transduction protein with GAF and PtsI domain
MEEPIAAWEDEGGSPVRGTESRMTGTVNQIAWAAQIKAQVNAEFDRVRATLVLAATVGLRPQCVGTLRMRLHEGLAGLVAEEVRPVAVQQVRNHPRFKYFREAGEDDYQSFLGVPLIDGAVLQGVLVVQRRQKRGCFVTMKFGCLSRLRLRWRRL